MLFGIKFQKFKLSYQRIFRRTKKVLELVNYILDLCLITLFQSSSIRKFSRNIRILCLSLTPRILIFYRKHAPSTDCFLFIYIFSQISLVIHVTPPISLSNCVHATLHVCSQDFHLQANTISSIRFSSVLYFPSLEGIHRRHSIIKRMFDGKWDFSFILLSYEDIENIVDASIYTNITLINKQPSIKTPKNYAFTIKIYVNNNPCNIHNQNCLV